MLTFKQLAPLLLTCASAFCLLASCESQESNALRATAAELERKVAELEAKELARQNAEVARLNAERIEEQRIEAARIEQARVEVARVEEERVRAEQEEKAREEEVKLRADFERARTAELERLRTERLVTEESARIANERAAQHRAVPESQPVQSSSLMKSADNSETEKERIDRQFEQLRQTGQLPADYEPPKQPSAISRFFGEVLTAAAEGAVGRVRGKGRNKARGSASNDQSSGNANDTGRVYESRNSYGRDNNSASAGDNTAGGSQSGSYDRGDSSSPRPAPTAVTLRNGGQFPVPPGSCAYFPDSCPSGVRFFDRGSAIHDACNLSDGAQYGGGTVSNQSAYEVVLALKPCN